MEKRVFSIAYQTHGYAWIMWIRNMMKIESLSSTGCRENSTWNLEFRRLVEWAIILGELHSTTTYNTNIYSNICTKTEKPRLHVQVGVEAPADCEQNSVPESTVEKWAICGKWNCDPNITPLHTFLQQNHPFRSLCLTLKRYFFHCSWHSFSEAMIWASWQIANLTVFKVFTSLRDDFTRKTQDGTNTTTVRTEVILVANAFSTFSGQHWGFGKWNLKTT